MAAVRQKFHLAAVQICRATSGSSRIRRSGSCISEQQRLTFCFMPPRACRRVDLETGRVPWLLEVRRCARAARPRLGRTSDRRSRCCQHAERRIEIAAKPLRHVGNTAVTRAAMVLIRHVSVEHHDFAKLDLAHPEMRRARWTCRRHRVRSIQPYNGQEYQV